MDYLPQLRRGYKKARGQLQGKLHLIFYQELLPSLLEKEQTEMAKTQRVQLMC
jgi:hypothetical protein